MSSEKRDSLGVVPPLDKEVVAKSQAVPSPKELSPYLLSSDAPDTAFRRRTSSVGLKVKIEVERFKPYLTRAAKVGPPDEVEEEGKELAAHFVSDHLEEQGLGKNLRQIENNVLCSTPLEYEHPIWAKTGKELRMLADSFSKTKERTVVKERAETCDIESLTYNQFKDLLTEMFNKGGVTKERIVVLFCFIGDIAARLLIADLRLFDLCLRWSLEYIRDKVCAWVRQAGGWERLFLSTNRMNQFVVGMFFGVIGFMAFQWLRNKVSANT